MLVLRTPMDGLKAKASAGRAFVGRERELTTIAETFEDLRSGRGRLILLAGEPGIGKTRTAEEAANIARRRGVRVLWGRCFESEGAPAFWPWVQVLRSGLALLHEEDLRRILGTDAARLALVLPDLREHLPNLPELQQGESPQVRFALIDSLARFLGGIARAAPLLVVLDDIHGADHSSLLLLEFICRAMRETPLCLMATYRDGGLTSESPLTATLTELAREPATERLTLHGLNLEEVAELLRVAGAQESGELASLIYQRTDGNPLFVGEFARSLSATGQLSGTRDLDPLKVALPRGVKTAIQRRLEPLSQACREVLLAAAVVGREFGRLTVAAVLAIAASVGGAAAAVRMGSPTIDAALRGIQVRTLQAETSPQPPLPPLRRDGRP